MRNLFVCVLFIALSNVAIAVSHESNNYALTPQQLHDFFDKGILIIPKFFNEQEVVQALESATRLQAQGEKLAKEQAGRFMYNGTQIVIEEVDAKKELARVVWAAAAEPQLLKLARQSKLLVPVGQILDTSKADHLINQLHYKYPNGGVALNWYQDIRSRKHFDPNWRDLNNKGSFLLAVIALEPMNVEQGTIYYIPNSHKLGDIKLYDTDPKQLTHIADLEKPVGLTLNPGDLVLWHTYLIHGGDVNKFSTPRTIFINGFSYPDANTKPYPGEGSAQSVDLK